MKLDIVSAAWGRWHIDALLEVCLPSLLAPGNLPELARRHRLELRIDTRREDMSLFRHPVLDDLRRLMPVEIAPALPGAGNEDIFTVQHERWLAAARRAKAEGAFIWTLSPDTALADGSLRHVADMLEAGKRSITWTWCRVVGDTLRAELTERFRRPPHRALAVPPRELVAASLRHLHPVMAAYLPESRYLPHHMEILVWPVKGEGLLAHVLASVNFIYDPALPLTPQNLLAEAPDPSSIHFVTDSDDLFGVSLAPLGKDAHWHLLSREPTPLGVGRWWWGFDSPINDHLSARPIRWHLGEMTEAAWQEQERRAASLIAAAAAAREGLRLWQGLREEGCELMASMVAAALDLGALDLPRTPLLVLAPDDAALERLSDRTLARLLAEGDGARLSLFIKHHCVAGDLGRALRLLEGADEGTATLTTLAGRTLAVAREAGATRIAGHRSRGRPLRAGSGAIQPVGGVLDAEAAAGS